MLVPLNSSQRPSPSGTDERTGPPGAVTSGFSCSVSAVGPADENDSIRSGVDDPCPPVAAAAAITLDAFAGELIEPLPKSLWSLPAEATGTTPASAAASSAF